MPLKIELGGQRQLGIAWDDTDVQVAVAVLRPARTRSERDHQPQPRPGDENLSHAIDLYLRQHAPSISSARALTEEASSSKTTFNDYFSSRQI